MKKLSELKETWKQKIIDFYNKVIFDETNLERVTFR